jgi:hypothetical protein
VISPASVTEIVASWIADPKASLLVAVERDTILAVGSGVLLLSHASKSSDRSRDPRRTAPILSALAPGKQPARPQLQHPLFPFQHDAAKLSGGKALAFPGRDFLNGSRAAVTTTLV